MKPEPQSGSGGADPLAATARRWLERRDAGLGPAERAELQAWLTADPRHRAAFAEADAARSALDWPVRAGAAEEIAIELEARAARRRRRRERLLLAAAAVAIFALGATVWHRAVTPAPDVPQPAANLAVLAPRQLTLPDGSRVESRTDALLAVEYSPAQRRVVLSRGAAHFAVEPDPRRPFVVVSGPVAAQAVGTAFAVERAGEEVTVLVTEGRVAVRAAAGEVTLVAGQEVRFRSAAEPPAPASLPAEEVRRRLDWRVPLLQFAGTPLAEIVAHMNARNREQIELAHPALGRFELSGALRADRVDALLAMLEANFGIEAERRGERIVLHPSR